MPKHSTDPDQMGLILDAGVSPPAPMRAPTPAGMRASAPDSTANPTPVPATTPVPAHVAPVDADHGIAVPPSLRELARPSGARRARSVQMGTSRRRSFVVGRLSRSSREMRVLDSSQALPIPGPWRLHALVHAPGARLRLV